MRDKQDHTLPSIPVSNYGAAVAKAVEWLGDRYLLATPINVRNRAAAPRPTIVHQLLKSL